MKKAKAFHFLLSEMLFLFIPIPVSGVVSDSVDFDVASVQIN